MSKVQKIDLDSLPEFKALDARRQTVCRGIQQGVSYSKAITSAGLNATRERKNEQLQRVLWLLHMGIPDARITQDAATTERTIYDEAADLEREMATWPADKRAAYDAEMERTYPSNRRPCGFCGAMVFGGEGVCEACQPKRRDLQPEAPKPAAIPTPAPTVTKRCRACGLEAGARDIVCRDAACVGALGVF